MPHGPGSQPWFTADQSHGPDPDVGFLTRKMKAMPPTHRIHFWCLSMCSLIPRVSFEHLLYTRTLEGSGESAVVNTEQKGGLGGNHALGGISQPSWGEAAAT